ncbi:sulfotransferase domain-containing protein [Sphingomonas immobilis]|uniref:Sulfotransferase domain-containing protein n=1 Tax=Sphingomonas immobilis TaxID=3063997 RepID=A0ABT8ZZY6_9SPHN|nr:sulfotransferase domain-containing protein [Sphingomonas sp. CA1-15]MDO7843147.1 sulfotransferase domain-containing protein [Sphingomonas sp. CA1-15]
MRPTVWLASYPKSGNTWFRIVLANLDSPDAAPADINALNGSDTIASARARFDNHLLIESGLLTFAEIDLLRPGLYRHLAADIFEDPFERESRYPVRFVKTHDAYTLTNAGEAMMGGAHAAAGAILFVRDPRDVAASLANHQSVTIDKAIGLMADPAFAFCGSVRGLEIQLRQQLLGWSAFAESWLAQADIPVHLVRYEDLHRDPVGAVRGALHFAGWRATDADIAEAVGRASIEELQRQEAKTGFGEAPPYREPGSRFFRRGKAGGWRDELTAQQVLRIERDHVAMMKRLGYEPVREQEDSDAHRQTG